jgi:hypothetical protein
MTKSRSLVVVPSNVRAGESFVVTRWVPTQSLEQAVVLGSDRGRLAGSVVDAARVASERRHRRCHSEQPRAWRRPSAALWTVKEYEE